MTRDLADGLVLEYAVGGRDAWRASEAEADELVAAMDEAAALDEGAIPAKVLTPPGGAASPPEIELSLLRLAKNPPDFTPDDWIDWLRWLGRAATAGGFRPGLREPDGSA